MNYLPRGNRHRRIAALAAAAAGAMLLAACSGAAATSATGTISPASGPKAAGFPGTAGSPSVLPTAEPSMSGMSMPASASPAAASRPVASNAVTIRNFAFGPQDVTVTAGTTVRWTNRDTDAHTVTSDTGVFHSAVLQPGSSYSFTFRKPGTYSYHCTIHPFMTGKVIVS